MIDEPTIVETTEQNCAVIRLTIPREEIRNMMGPAMEEVITTVALQKIGPAGPLFSYHLRLDPAVFDFEVGVPVSAPVSPTGRVVEGKLPAARVVRTIYRGPYEGLPDAWKDFNGWIGKAGHKPAGDLWERYLVGPDSSQDPSQWQTELSRRLA
ncbi:MAG: GyrI-like domain-containing protein [Candidatus Eisenbacteria bacterium]